jgi:hypothetical protein
LHPLHGGETLAAPGAEAPPADGGAVLRGAAVFDLGVVVAAEGTAHKKESPSFLKKRSKKLLTLGIRLAGSARKEAKVFWFFFSKKNAFLNFPFRSPM